MANKGLIAGVVLPLALVLRFPGAIIAVGRVVVFFAEMAFLGLIYSGNFTYASTWLWRRMIAMAKEKTKHR